MKGNLLALGAVAALAWTGVVASRRGSLNIPSDASPLQKRLLYVLQTYPETSAVRALELVSGLSGVLDRTVGPGTRSVYLYPTGVRQLKRDFVEMNERNREEGWVLETPTILWRSLILSGTWHEGSVLTTRSGWEPLIAWIGKEVHRVSKTLPPIARVPASYLTRARGAGGFITKLTVDQIQSLISYYLDFRDSYDREARQYRDIETAEEVRWEEYRMTRIFRGKDPRSEYLRGWTDTQYRGTLDLPGNQLFGEFLFDMYVRHPDQGPPSFPVDAQAAADVLVAEHLRQFAVALPEIRDWVGSGEAGDINRFTYEEARKRAKTWHATIERATGMAGERRVAHSNGKTIATLRDGWTIQELGDGDLKPQSEVMGHCVGKGDTYRNKIREGTGRILSVRDDGGRSVFTIELSRHIFREGPAGGARSDVPAEWMMVQFKGQGNRVPGLTKEKTKSMPYGFNEVKNWIMRAKKPFVSMVDVDRAAEVVATLRAMDPRINVETLDLSVVRAVGKMPDARSP